MLSHATLHGIIGKYSVNEITRRLREATKKRNYLLNISCCTSPPESYTYLPTTIKIPSTTSNLSPTKHPLIPNINSVHRRTPPIPILPKPTQLLNLIHILPMLVLLPIHHL